MHILYYNPAFYKFLDFDKIFSNYIYHRDMDTLKTSRTSLGLIFVLLIKERKDDML